MTGDWLEGWAEDSEPPAAIDTTVAHQARIYDYWLGGKDNFAVDREAAQQAIAAYPPILRGVRAQRAFLVRAVRYLAAQAGIRQFLDIGTGIPTANNTHQVAQAAAPGARVVYVDNDPLVLAHARALLTSVPEDATAYLDADARDPDEILAGAAGLSRERGCAPRLPSAPRYSRTPPSTRSPTDTAGRRSLAQPSPTPPRSAGCSRAIRRTPARRAKSR